MYRKVALVIFFFVNIIVFNNVNAATIVFDEDAIKNYEIYSATKILGLSVGTITYDVEFKYVTYASEWGTGYDVPDQATAWSVRNAIVTEFNNNSTVPSRVGGPWPLYKYFLIPYDTAANGDIISAVGWDDLNTAPITWTASYDNYNTPELQIMYARLEAVPIPGTILLFGSSFIGLVGLGRKLST